MIHDHLLQFTDLIFVGYCFHMDHFLIQTLIQVILHIKNICDTTTHAGCKVLSGASKDYHLTTCHIFATMITDTFNNCGCSGVTNCKSLTGNAVDICLATGCSVKCYITDNNIVFMDKFCGTWRIYDQLTTGKSFSEVVIAVSDKL